MFHLAINRGKAEVSLILVMIRCKADRVPDVCLLMLCAALGHSIEGSFVAAGNVAVVDRRRYNALTSDEIAGIIPDDNLGTASSRDIVVQLQGGGLPFSSRK